MKILIAAVGTASLGLAGCAAIPDDRGKEVSEQLLASRSSAVATALKPPADAQRSIDEGSAQPLDADASVRLALLKNPRMQLLYAELGLAQAEVYDASRLSNPTLGYVELSADGHVAKTTWSLSQRFTELLFLRVNTRVARSRLLQTQQRVADEVLSLEAEVRRAYYGYVGDRLVAQMRERVAMTAAASAQHAQQLYEAGNISELQLKREQAAASTAAVHEYKAQARAAGSRSVFFKALGVSTEASLQFVDRLNLPIKQAQNAQALQSWALQQRLDLAAIREELRSTQTLMSHRRHWRWLGGVDVGAERERDRGVSATGPSASLELPLFNSGGGSVMRVQARVETLNAQLAALELAIRNDVVAQLAELQAAEQVVDEHRERLVPLRERIVELSQQQQNFMLIGAFELLSSKQDELDSYQSYLESVRDYWIARAELARVAGGRLQQAIPENAVSVGIDPEPAGETP